MTGGDGSGGGDGAGAGDGNGNGGGKPGEGDGAGGDYAGLKIPQGSGLDEATLNDYKVWAKSQGMSEGQAQASLDREHSAVGNMLQAQQDELAEKKSSWMTEMQNDKELGGDNLKETAALANRVLTKYGTDELRKQLDDTGLGNYPPLVRTFVKIGKAMGEDKIVMPDGNGGDKAPKKSLAEKLYGNTTPSETDGGGKQE